MSVSLDDLKTESVKSGLCFFSSDSRFETETN